MVEFRLSKIRIMDALSSVTPKNIELMRARVEADLHQQNWDDCIQSCRSLLKLDPRHHFAQETLATALLQIGETDAAVAAVKRLLEISPRDPMHRLRYATMLQMQDQFGLAAREFERIALMYPDSPFTPDAREAIENLDRMQTSQILMMAAEHDEFRWKLERDMTELLEENEFYLSENAAESLRQMIPNSEIEVETRAPKVH